MAGVEIERRLCNGRWLDIATLRAVQPFADTLHDCILNIAFKTDLLCSHVDGEVIASVPCCVWFWGITEGVIYSECIFKRSNWKRHSRVVRNSSKTRSIPSQRSSTSAMAKKERDALGSKLNLRGT